MQDVWMLLACVLGVALLLLIPWAIIWGTYGWPRLRYARAAEETAEAKAVNLHDAMPYLHNRYGEQVEPLLPVSLYYVTFKAEGREPMRFRVSREDYYRIRQGDRGLLTFRGRLFVRFDVKRSKNEAIFKDSE